MQSGSQPHTLRQVLRGPVHNWSPELYRHPMRLLTQLLWLLILASVILFILAAVHGFSGTYCLHSYAQAGCGNNPHLSGVTIAWAAPLTVVISHFLLVALDRRR